MSKRYRIKATGKKSAELLIYGDIGSDWFEEESNDAKTIVSKLSDISESKIDVRINSYGGVVSDGLAIFNALNRHPSKVVTHIDGVAYSIASLIAMGGSEIHMADNAMMMIHAPWGLSMGNAVDMREMADTLDLYASSMVGAYVRDGGPEKETIKEWLSDGKDHYFTSEMAVDLGFVDNVTAPIDIAAALRGVSHHQIPAEIAAQHRPENIMPEPVIPDSPANTDDTAIDPIGIVDQYNEAQKAGADAGAKSEAKRQKEIRSLYARRSFQAPQIRAVLDVCLEDTRCDKATAMDRALAAAETLPENLPINTTSAPAEDGGAFAYTPPPYAAPLGGHRQGGNVSGGMHREGAGIRVALMIRSGLEKDRNVIAKERTSEFLSMSLVDLMARELRAMGHRVGGTREDIARAYVQSQHVMGAGPSHGTDHLTGILADVANKSAMMGWEAAPETWNVWTQEGTLNDYRAAQRANLALLDKLDKMLEHEEWEYGNLSDVKQSIQGFFYGKKYGLSIQAIVNDDLSELTRAFEGWGEAGSVTIGDVVFALLTVSGTGGFGQTMDEDSQILFHADHSNYIASGSGGAPSAATIGAARTAMATVTDQNSRAVVSRPRYIIHPTALTQTVWPLLNSSALITGADGTIPESNWTASLGLGSVEEYRMDAFVVTAWILAAARRTVEVSGVGGPLQPRIDRSMISNIPGITYEMSLPFGAAVLDYRGFYLNYGA